MNITLVTRKIDRGFRKAATILGDPYSWYRASAALQPALSAGNLQGTLDAQFATDPGFTFARPSQYGKPSWYALVDPTNVLAGDYFTGLLGTFFIADIERIAPAQAVFCNRVVTLWRPQQQTATGLNGYGGNTLAGQTKTLDQWPASLLQRGRQRTGETRLPGDTYDPMHYLLLPASPAGVTFESRDLVTDDLGERYVVVSTELTLLGWRMEVQQVLA